MGNCVDDGITKEETLNIKSDAKKNQLVSSNLKKQATEEPDSDSKNLEDNLSNKQKESLDVVDDSPSDKMIVDPGPGPIVEEQVRK